MRFFHQKMTVFDCNLFYQLIEPKWMDYDYDQIWNLNLLLILNQWNSTCHIHNWFIQLFCLHTFCQPQMPYELKTQIEHNQKGKPYYRKRKTHETHFKIYLNCEWIGKHFFSYPKAELILMFNEIAYAHASKYLEFRTCSLIIFCFFFFFR